MPSRFHPLPAEIFTDEQRPYIQRLNRELVELFGLEGTLRQPVVVKRSDNTIARRSTEQVHVSRITPDIGEILAGTSTAIGAPNLTLGQTNTVGTTNTVVSIDSGVALFDTTAPADVAAAASVGVIAFAARRDHVHAHGSVAGDGHPAYILASGERGFTGSQSLGGNTLTNVRDVSGTADQTLDIISLAGNSSTAVGFRLIWDINAATPAVSGLSYSKNVSVGYRDDSDVYHEAMSIEQHAGIPYLRFINPLGAALIFSDGNDSWILGTSSWIEFRTGDTTSFGFTPNGNSSHKSLDMMGNSITTVDQIDFKDKTSGKTHSLFFNNDAFQFTIGA